MTRVVYEPERFRLEIRGHAGMGEPGRDLACAAVSALAFTLVNAAGDVPDYLSRVSLEPRQARVCVQCCPDEELEERCREMFRTVLTGFRILEQSYPDCVCVECEEEEEIRNSEFGIRN